MSESTANPSKSPKQSNGTVLPFPERFHEAVKYVTSLPEDTPSLTDETRLMLYALHQQAVRGQCTDPKPWSWNVVESAKYNSWIQLGDMASVEAMRLYVKLLESEIQPDWWIQSRGAELESAGKQSRQTTSINNIQSLTKALEERCWSELRITETKLPPPRYEHAIAVVNRKLYVIGGNCNGRYLNDIWTLDFDSLAWDHIQYKVATQESSGGEESNSKSETRDSLPAFPQIAGHSLVVWGTTILCIGGHTKGWQSRGPGQIMIVRAFNTETNTWSLLNLSGNPPPNRGSHSASLIGDSIYIFGGEEKSRQTSNDLFILNLTNMSWETVEKSSSGPQARSGHAALSLDDRFLLILGGGSVGQCYGDLWVLDTKSNTWQSIASEGLKPSPRAGHVGGYLRGNWYIAGGGNNTSGCKDVLTLDLSNSVQSIEDKTFKAKWEVNIELDSKSSIVSEGMGIVSVENEGVLLTFGGYNGRYLNVIHVYKAEKRRDPGQEQAYSSQESQIGDQRPSNGVKEIPLSEGSDKQEKSDEGIQPLTPRKSASQNGTQTSQTGKNQDGLKRLASLDRMAKDAQASRDAMQSEVGLMRKQLNAALEGKSKLEKEVERLRYQLSNEQNKSLKLEVALAEAKQKLSTVSELERELGNYRKLLEEAEQKGKSKAGLWGYIAGTDK